MEPEEIHMRKVVASEFVSLDGVAESPDRWQLQYFSDEIGEAVGAAMSASDTMLLGRVTYQEFESYFPGVSSEDQPFANYMNDTPKFVVSTTLEKAEWNNSTLIKDDVVEVITRQSSNPARISGFPAVSASSSRCCVKTSSTSLGTWFIPLSWGTGSVSSRTWAIRRH
jgi:hypothetical protein